MRIIKNILLRVGSGIRGGVLPAYCALDALQDGSYKRRKHCNLKLGGFVVDVCLWERLVRVKYGFSEKEDVCICGGSGEGWRFCFSDVYHPHLRIEVGEDKYMGYFGRFSEYNNRERSCFVVVEGGKKYMFEGANVRIVLNNLMAMQVYLKFKDKFWSRLLQSRKARDLRWRLLNFLLAVDWSWLVSAYDGVHNVSGLVDEFVNIYKRVVFTLLKDFDCYIAGFKEDFPFLPVRIEQGMLKNLVNDSLPGLIIDWLVEVVFGERLEQGVGVHLPERWRGGVVSLIEELVLSGRLRLWGADEA